MSGGPKTLPKPRSSLAGFDLGDLALVTLSWLAAANCRLPLISVGPLLPLLVADLGLSATVAGALAGLPLLLIGLLSIPAGLLVDRVGARPILATTQVVVVLAGAGRALAPGVVPLFVATALMGVGVGVAQPAFARVARQARSIGPGPASAIYSNGFILGSLIALGLTVPVLLPLTGGSWRGPIVFWAAIGSIAAVGWIAAAVQGGAEERRQAIEPGAVLAAFRIPGLLLVSGVNLAQTLLYYGLISWVPALYVQHGWALRDAATPLLSLQAAAVVVSFTMPIIGSRRSWMRWGILVGAGIAVLGMVGFLVWPTTGTHAWAALVGGGTAVIFVYALAAPAILAPGRSVGAAAGVVLMVGYVGSILGPFLVGALRDLTGSFMPGLAFLTVVTISLAAGVVVLVRRGT